MELTRATPLYAVVEGNKKCKSKRVGVGEWEKNKRRMRMGEKGEERCELEKEREREREREKEHVAATPLRKGTERRTEERKRNDDQKKVGNSLYLLYPGDIHV